jgi:sulfate permease, SulP family
MELFDRILVGLSGTDADAGLLRYARMLCELAPGAVFEFVHVSEDGKPLPDIAAAVAEHFGTSGHIKCRVVPGHREDQVLAAAGDLSADLILVGHRKSRSGRRSLARRLAMKAPCSIWMAPEGFPPRLNGLLAAVDFSHHSEHALSVATAIAARRGLDRCRALHVYFDQSIAGIEEYQTHVRGREQEAFDEFAGSLDLHGVTVEPVFEESSSVSHAIARTAASGAADLVVMGTRGLSRSASILLGSESEQTIMETQIPVLIVKRRGERVGLLKVLLEHQYEPVGSPKFG